MQKKEKEKVSLEQFLTLMATSPLVAKQNNVPVSHVSHRVKLQTAEKNAIYTKGDMVVTNEGAQFIVGGIFGYQNNGMEKLPSVLYFAEGFEGTSINESDIKGLV